MIQCFNFDQVLYSHYKYTVSGKIDPSTTIKYLYTVYAWIWNHTLGLNSCGVSFKSVLIMKK